MLVVAERGDNKAREGGVRGGRQSVHGDNLIDLPWKD